MQFEKVKQEIIDSKKRDFVQNHTFYAQKEIIIFCRKKKKKKKKNCAKKSIQVKK